MGIGAYPLYPMVQYGSRNSVVRTAYSLTMPADGSVLVVPVRSNAHTLLAGAPIAAMRRRLKFASLFYDRLLLETGILRVHAGPHGSSSFIVPPTDDDPPRWQTPAERRAGTGATFVVAVSPDGRPDAPPQTAVASEATIAWTATLHPFADELPPGTDWVDFVTSRNPTGEMQRLAQRWTWADERNRSLEHAIPIKFVRDTIISGANRDLVLAAAAGFSVTIDRLHSQVAAQRFNDEEGWKLRGYVVPIIFPHVGDLPWEAIADFRRDRGMARFREVLREVEQQAAAETPGGDIEAVANRLYRRHLAEASEAIDTVGIIGHKTLAGIVIGAYTGSLTSGIIGPLGILAGAVTGVIPGTVIDVRNMIRQRRSKSWVSLSKWIDQST